MFIGLIGLVESLVSGVEWLLYGLVVWVRVRSLVRGDLFLQDGEGGDHRTDPTGLRGGE